MKEVEKEYNPLLDKAIGQLVGGYTDADGTINYKKVLESATKISAEIGGGNYMKEVVMTKHTKVGFWHSTTEPHLPKPVPSLDQIRR